ALACSRSSGSFATRVAIGVIASATLSVRSLAGTGTPPSMGISVTLPPMDLERVNAILAEWGEPEYRWRQVYAAATRELVGSYEQITSLPVALRRRLSEAEPLLQLEPAERQLSADGTIKMRFATRDGFPVEAVAMKHRNRRTICVSSQSGCPLACTFCATGTMGLGRNLTAGEISEQVLVLAAILRESGERVSNVVMMGMGEPFLNYDAVLDACRTL